VSCAFFRAAPMTNIATLIQNHPDIIPQIEKFQSVQQERQGY
jgi:inosine-uridine nucleoside N-ribohydrolase